MGDRLVGVFASVLDVPEAALNDDSSPSNTPQWDSLATVNLTLAIESEFGVRLRARQIMSMTTIGLARDVLRTLGVSDP